MDKKTQDLDGHRKAIIEGTLLKHLESLGYTIQPKSDYRLLCLTWGQYSDDDMKALGLTAENGYGLRRDVAIKVDRFAAFQQEMKNANQRGLEILPSVDGPYVFNPSTGTVVGRKGSAAYTDVTSLSDDAIKSAFPFRWRGDMVNEDHHFGGKTVTQLVGIKAVDDLIALIEDFGDLEGISRISEKVYSSFNELTHELIIERYRPDGSSRYSEHTGEYSDVGFAAEDENEASKMADYILDKVDFDVAVARFIELNKGADTNFYDILEDSVNAGIYKKQINIPGKLNIGPIIEINEFHIVQEIEPGMIVKHEKKNFQTLPAEITDPYYRQKGPDDLLDRWTNSWIIEYKNNHSCDISQTGGVVVLNDDEIRHKKLITPNAFIGKIISETPSNYIQDIGRHTYALHPKTLTGKLNEGVSYSIKHKFDQTVVTESRIKKNLER